MPCFDLGLDIYDDEFIIVQSPEGVTTYAPEDKKFVSASWQFCHTVNGNQGFYCDCDGHPAIGDLTVMSKPNDDLTEWTFWVTGSSSFNKFKVRMVTIDA